MITVDRIALISDVHGNLTALEAVLADIDARGITRIFNLGDYVGKGPRGREVVALCKERCEVNILGNWDDFLPDPSRALDDCEALRWWRAELAEGQGDWLRGLPFHHDFWLSGRRVRLFHASATSVHVRVRYDHDEVEFAGMFHNTPATGDGPPPDIVGYGDTHDAFCETDRGKTLFNTGSVGNPMDEPTPVYVILEGRYGSQDPGPFSITFVRVPYDVDAELAAARELGAPEFELYEAELRRAAYRGDVRRGEAPAYHRRSLVAQDPKDWTWTLQKPCPDCGFAASEVDGGSIGALIEAAMAPWPQIAMRADARRRPSPQIWSPLEYACHVRDVCTVFTERLALMLEQDSPTFADWDQDTAAAAGNYAAADPATVVPQLEASAAALAAAYDAVQGDQFARKGLRSNGSAFTVLTLGQYCLHDLMHHLHDVGVDQPSLPESAASS
ncbi:hypothetical protein G9U51_02045 [Calidifontibacter sp. DB0510]|uniref:Metallophosphoesterase n=1 Tax=Metallococcus carri TaxID=1656884 RepID=A0A967AX23_9MICO|nr:metallophosphoesterase family protein [Metallococcus carri]NHN54561.1 hypothetical protein [Metallococcus carri]NOP36600.1 hypothetical protein [Calidifontibacter sp. DB2511S]